MRRGALQFVLLLLLGAALSIAASLCGFGVLRAAGSAAASTTNRASSPRNSRRTVLLRARRTSVRSIAGIVVEKGDVSPDDPCAGRHSCGLLRRKPSPASCRTGRRPAWDPFHAQQDMDVGMFYLHKGDVDAAIAGLKTRSACEPISRSRAFCSPRATRRRATRPRR